MMKAMFAVSALAMSASGALASTVDLDEPGAPPSIAVAGTGAWGTGLIELNSGRDLVFANSSTDPIDTSGTGGTAPAADAVPVVLNSGRDPLAGPGGNGGGTGTDYDAAAALDELLGLIGTEGTTVTDAIASSLSNGFGRDTAAEELLALLETSGTGSTGSGGGTGTPVDTPTGAAGDGDLGAISTVPLPAGLPLLLAGLAGLGLIRRMRKAA